MEHTSDSIFKRTNRPPLASNRSPYSLNGKIMLCSVIVLFSVMLILFCFHGYARWLLKRRRRNRRQAQRRHLFSSNTTVKVPPRGLDLLTLKALPSFVYKSAANDGDPVFDCAVCLSEFDDGEEGRVLPKCKHTFHIECIDMWFQSHSNCPLCRAPVQPLLVPDHDGGGLPEIAIETAVETSVPEPALRRKEGPISSLPVTLSPLECRRMPLELVGIVVESSSSTTGEGRVGGLVGMGMGLGSPGSQGPKSPVNRVFPLKRIWSV